MIFPGGTSVIRHATHGVIYASRSSRKRIQPLDTYYALRSSSSSPSSSPSSPRSLLISTLSRLSVSIFRELSHSSCVEPEKSNEALVGSTNVYRPVANAIRKSTWWYPDYPRNHVQGGPVCSPVFSMTYLLATTVADERAKRALCFFTH